MSDESNAPAADKDELDFSDHRPVCLPVTLPPEKEGGPVRRYVLREASEEATIAYNNVFTSAARMDGAKVVGMGGISEADAVLLSHCLFRVEPDGKEYRVLLSQVKALPHRITGKLAAKAKEVSGLATRAEDKGAPAPKGSEPTSEDSST